MKSRINFRILLTFSRYLRITWEAYTFPFIFEYINICIPIFAFNTLSVQVSTVGSDHNTEAQDINSGSRAPTWNGLDNLIDPAQSMHLQFGLFSVPISCRQLAQQRLWYVLS